MAVGRQKSAAGGLIFIQHCVKSAQNSQRKRRKPVFTHVGQRPTVEAAALGSGHWQTARPCGDRSSVGAQGTGGGWKL